MFDSLTKRVAQGGWPMYPLMLGGDTLTISGSGCTSSARCSPTGPGRCASRR